MSDLATFRQRLHQTFRMEDGADVHDVVLAECEAGGDESSFSLTFVGGTDVPAVQGTYLLSADGLAPMPVFLVPLSRDASGVSMHAVFNQRPLHPIEGAET